MMKSIRRILACEILALGIAVWLVPEGLAADTETQSQQAATTKFSPEQEEFFEKRVRPLLAKHCIECHGPDTQEGGMRFDSRAHVLAGAEGIRAVVPGKPEQSRIVSVMRYDGNVQMPPDGKLPSEEQAVLIEWIKQGVPWTNTSPTDERSTAVSSNFDERIARARTNHWALQPIGRPNPPNVSDAAWCANPIDRFVLARLDAKQLKPSPAADRRTLLRRVSIDLTGLPPTADEVAAFENDSLPGAYERVVERLLASPAYGERWGRHWLDLARYADTKGYAFQQEGRFPYAYTYRNYVVDAFNKDLPFDRFVLEQLAADQLDLGDDKRPLAAMGFITVGRQFNTLHDTIDDQIDVVARGLLGLTVTCARCHDHKFDPIPAEDYYSLYGVFRSSVAPTDPPLLGEPPQSPEYTAYLKDSAKLEADVDHFIASEHQKVMAEIRGRVTDYLVKAALLKMGKTQDHQGSSSFDRGDPRPQVVRRWRDYLDRNARKDDPVFGPWHRFEATKADEFPKRAPEIVAELVKSGGDAKKPVNRLIVEAFAKQPPKTMLEVAQTYGKLLGDLREPAADESTSGQDSPAGEKPAAENKPDDKTKPKDAGAQDKKDKKQPEPIDKNRYEDQKTPLEDPSAEQLRQTLYGEQSPTTLNVADAKQVFDRATKGELTKLQKKLDEFKVTSPGAPPRAMSLVDDRSPFKPYVFVRGDANRHGKDVPRQFLAVLSSGDREPFQHGSGRLDLARAIVDPKNPLPARVLANRIWMLHFGTPLVITPSDFGVRSEPPSHPDLLDYLAGRLIDGGWSLKDLHRQMVLSSTYQQASLERREASAVDPENRLFWRMNRRRLELEPLRDSMLFVAGRLSMVQGGKSVDLWKAPYSRRRAVYGFVDRQDLPGVFHTFDFANPDVTTDARPQTTVPQQALFVMNSPFVLEQARAVSARPEIESKTDPRQRATELYRVVLGRTPQSHELDLALRLVDSLAAATPVKEDRAIDAKAPQQLAPWEMLAHVLLLTNEFMFVD